MSHEHVLNVISPPDLFSNQGIRVSGPQDHALRPCLLWCPCLLRLDALLELCSSLKSPSKEKGDFLFSDLFALYAHRILLKLSSVFFAGCSYKSDYEKPNGETALIKYQRLKAYFILALSNPLSLISPLFYLLQNCLMPDGFEGKKIDEVLGILSEAKL